MPSSFDAIDVLAINSIRVLSIDAIEKAKSGHPGLPMGAAPMAYVLWRSFLQVDPSLPSWPNRDRFVLSPGHGSMLLYSLLHLSGYALSLDDLKAFRQIGSLTPGHPEFGLTPGVEATTGPLGQGAANAVGMAIAERYLSRYFNRPDAEIVNHHTYALVSDGDLMEGVAQEAASLAGQMKLGKLTYLYDSNDITLDGPTSLAFSVEDVSKRFESYGWHTIRVESGNTDLNAIHDALQTARSIKDRPSLILVKTTIGYGSPNKAGKSDAHGSPLGPEEAKLAKAQLNWTEKEPFSVPSAVKPKFQVIQDRGTELRNAWEQTLKRYRSNYPELAVQWDLCQSGKLPEGWLPDLNELSAPNSMATRKASGIALNAIADRVPWLLGGDADLSVSTNTALKNKGSFDGTTGQGRNIHYGVREHAMGAIANGIAYHGGLRTFTATFFCFSDYMKPSIRLAAMNHLPVTFVFTHDSIGVGEDGPTHQPVEHLAALRAMPNLIVARPADSRETGFFWELAVESQKTPVTLVLSRQNLPLIQGSSKDCLRGGYIVSREQSKPQIVLLATGSEVALALEVKKLLQSKNLDVRVVSMPSWGLFRQQSESYRSSILGPSSCFRTSIEAASPMGWKEWVGEQGIVIGIEQYGYSAPADEVYKKLGLAPAAIVDKILKSFPG